MEVRVNQKSILYNILEKFSTIICLETLASSGNIDIPELEKAYELEE